MRYEHLFRKGFQENSTFFPQRILSWRNQTRIITAGEVKSGKKKKKIREFVKHWNSLWKQNQLAPQGSSRIFSASPPPPTQLDMTSRDAANEQFKKPHEFSIRQFPRLCSSSFPLTHDSCPSSSQKTEKVPGPPPYSPLCQPPVRLSSSHPSASCCWVKSQGILVPMTEVWMATATQLRWDHACELSLQMIKPWLDKCRRWLFYDSEAHCLIHTADMP